MHIAPLLEERMKEAGVEPETMKEYVDGFRWGCPPVSTVVQVRHRAVLDVNSSSMAEVALVWSASSCSS